MGILPFFRAFALETRNTKAPGNGTRTSIFCYSLPRRNVSWEVRLSVGLKWPFVRRYRALNYFLGDFPSSPPQNTKIRAHFEKKGHSR